MKEIIKIKTQDRELKNNRKKINITESYVFEKVHKIDSPLTRFKKKDSNN